MRQLQIVFMFCLLSGCVAVWGSAYHVESEDASGGAIRYDHVVISERAIQVHANEICARYHSIAVVENQRYGVVVPGGSIDEISFSCKAPGIQPESRSATKMPSESSKAAEQSSGSGYLVNNDGDILTNFHVVDGCRSVNLRRGERTYSANVVALDQVSCLQNYRRA